MNYTQILHLALEKPKVIYAITLCLVIFSAALIPNISIDTDPENMLNSDAPARIYHNDIKSRFQMHDMMVVGAISKDNIFSTAALQHLSQLSDYIAQMDGVIVQDLLSLNVVDNISQTPAGEIRFEYLMKQAPTTQQASDEIQQAVKRLPMLNNTLVSDDGKAAAIYVPLTSKSQSYEVAQQVRQFTTSLDSELSFYITGLPVAEEQFGVEMFTQMAIAAPLAGLAIFILLWFFFRNMPLIIAPMIVAMATVIIIMGALIGMGFTVHIMSSMIAIFLMPIAVVDSVHILSEFADNHRQGKAVKTTLKQVMQHLYTPMLYTSITSAVGFFSLMLTPIPPVKVFGAFIGSGILLAFILTITFIPAYISRLSLENLAKLQNAMVAMESRGTLGKSLAKLGQFSSTKVKLIIFVFVGIFVLSSQGINKIEVNDNPINWFKTDHEIRQADKALNQHFAGTYDAWLVVANQNDTTNQQQQFLNKVSDAKQSGLATKQIEELIQQNTNSDSFFNQELLIALDDLAFEVDESLTALISELYQVAEQSFNDNKLMMQPAMLNWIAKLEKALVNEGLVGKTNSLTDIVKTVNRELYSGQDEDFAIPTSAEGVAQTLLQYQSSHRPNDLWHFVTKDYQQGLVWLQMTSGDNQHTTKVVNWVNQYVEDNPAPNNVSINWAGKSYLNIVWQEAMVSGMLESLFSSFIIVFLMMVLLFRSIKYGVLAMLPLTFTITMIYGLIGWAGKSYDMPIAVLSALTLGLSIDFAIHFLQRARELEKQLGSLSKALNAMFDEPAKAISRNAIVVAIGFTPLLLSPLVPYITVGMFLASIMLLSAFVTLVLLPALLKITQPIGSIKHKAVTGVSYES